MKYRDSLNPVYRKKLENRKFFILYSAAFAVTALAVLGYFFVLKKTFITPGDGFKQHFKAFVYFGRYIREIIRTLINEHSLVIPQWSYSIGYGGDILTTLHYYVIGDPLDLISVIVPVKYSIFAYTLLMIFRFYLSGLSFSIYCRYRNAAGITACAAGGLVYSFTTYSLFFAFVHPFFMNPVIYLPLILLGVEKIFDAKRPYLLTVMVFISAVSNFYFFYMLVLVTVFYVLFRLFFIYKKGELKRAVGSVFKIGISSAVGVLMSCAVFIPVTLAFMGDSRTGDAIEVNLLYPFSYYKNFLAAYTTSNANMGSMTSFGISCVALTAVFLMFIKKGKNKELKILFAVSTLLLLLPAVGYIMNGFSYIANRWVWAYIMLVAYILVVMWEDLISINLNQGIALLGMLCVYSVCAFICIKEFDKNLAVSVAVGTAAIIAMLSASRLKLKKLSGGLLIILIIISLSANSYFNSSGGNVDKNNYYGYIRITNELIDNPATKVEKAVDDDSFYRYSGSRLVVNSDLVNSTKGTSFYWSLQNSNIAQFIDEMDLPYRYLYQYYNLDNRAALNALAAVKYYESGSIYNKPYGFDEIKEDIYENANCLPIGYTYSAYITRDMYDGLTAVEKQQALLQGVLLEEEQPQLEKAEPVFTQQSVDYTLVTDDNCTYENGILTVNKKNAEITLYFDGIENSETYISLELNDFDSKEKAGTLKFSAVGATDDTVCAENTYTFNSKYSIRHDNRNQLLFNTGYSEEAKKSITVKVNTAGVYYIPEISVICQPMDNFSAQINELKADTLENVCAADNTITGTISLEKSKILCLSVPYSKGWSAYVDGEETQILKADTMYMALVLDEGEHNIELVYHTPYLKAGICLSALGFAGFAGYIVFYETSLKRKKSAV